MSRLSLFSLLIAVSGCSVLSLTGTPLRCDDDDACPGGQVCVQSVCLDVDEAGGEGEGDGGEGEGDGGEGEGEVGEGEGDVGEGEGEVGEGEGDVGEGEGDVGEGEGDVGEGEGEGEVVVCVDTDGDGAGAGCGADDCNDADPRQRDGEVCDGFDNDCDGVVDEDDVCGCVSVVVGAKPALFCAEQVTWPQALASCAARPGHRLLRIDDNAEEADLEDQLDDDQSAWFDATDAVAEGMFKHDDGSALEFTDFVANQPNNIDNQDCLAVGAAGMNDVDCVDILNPYYCERFTPLRNCDDSDGDGFGDGCRAGPDCDDDDATVAVAAVDVDDGDGDGAFVARVGCVAAVPAPPLPLPPPAVPDCDDDDDVHALACRFVTTTSGGATFDLHLEQYDHATARAACAEDGRRLALVDNATQRNALEALISGAELIEAWINGDDIEVEGDFVDENGAPLPFTSFGAGEPNNFGGDEDCLDLKSNGMNDAFCSHHDPFICRR